MYLDNCQVSCRPTQFYIVSQQRNSVRGFSLRDWLQLTQHLFGIWEDKTKTFVQHLQEKNCKRTLLLKKCKYWKGEKKGYISAGL